MYSGHPADTGCYLTETGEDITIAFRNVNDDHQLC